MLNKIYQYDGHFEHTGEARLQIVDRRDLRLHRNEKYASEDIWGHLSTIKPEPGKTTILVLAMSANEYYGPNRNGDAFSERPVELNGQMLVKPGEELPCHHKSFENGHFFKHHINKDPAKKLGDVLQAAYNWVMHRVELLCQLDKSRAADTIGRIEGGEFPGVSMGCKIDYDCCSICGNKAPTRAQYCNHVNGSDPRYGMNSLMPNGQRCFVYNPNPRFFDISEVFKPADRIGYTMKKVAADSRPYNIRLAADLGERVASLEEKRALLGKMSEIDKIIRGAAGKPGEIDQVDPNTQRFAREIAPKMAAPMVDVRVLASMKQASLPEIVSSFMKLGMTPSAPELFVMICQKDGYTPPRGMIEKVAKSQGALADLLTAAPQVLDQLEKTALADVSPAFAQQDIVTTLLPWREKRALYREYLARRYVPESYGVALGEQTGLFDPDEAYYTPTNETLHFQDPSTGKLYQTTRGVAEQTDLSNKSKEVAEAAGLAGVLALMYKGLTLSPKTQWAAPAAALGTGALGYKAIQGQKMPVVQTLEGEQVPANTEFAEKRGGFMLDTLTPITGGALLTMLMAQDYSANPAESPISQLAWTNPIATTVGTTAGVGGAVALGKRALGNLVKKGSINPAEPEPVNLNDVVFLAAKITLS